MKATTELIRPRVALDSGAGESFDIEDCEDFIGLAEQLMDGHHAGVLATVDGGGHPHVRWMGTMSFEEFPRFFALTSPQSAKVAHINRHAAVEWMFSNSDLTFILNLAGHARILQDTASIKRVWKAVGDKSHAFFLHSYNEKPGFAVIETVVDRIECTVPKSDIKWPASIDSFRRCLAKPTTINATVASPSIPLQLDEVLCQQVGQLATGANIHECENLVGAYRAAVAGFQHGDAAMLGVARDAARDLRRLLTRSRFARYSRLRNE